MRLIAFSLATVALVAGFTCADAQSRDNRTYRNYHDRYDRYDDPAWRAFRRLVPGYQARNPDNFRYGSPDWWKAMDREGRGGHPRL